MLDKIGIYMYNDNDNNKSWGASSSQSSSLIPPAPHDTSSMKYLMKYKREYAHIFQGAAEARQHRDWPDWCYIPMSVVARLADDIRIIGELGNLTAVIAWNQTKGIYRFDETLLESVWDTEISKIPTALLFRLPEWCVWIETPSDKDSDGFFAYLEYDRTKRVELRFCLSQDGILEQYILHLDQETVDEAIKAAINLARENATKLRMDIDFTEEDAHRIKRIITPRLSLLLYLCAVNADITHKGIPETPQNPQPVKTKRGAKEFPIPTPKAWDVGFRIGAAIRRAQQRESAKGGGTHASPRPHVRRGHYHLYWTGPKSSHRKPSIKWLSPILVNFDGGDIPATIRRIEHEI